MHRSRFTRIRWWLEDLRETQDAKVIAGLSVLAVLVAGGFLAARMVARASTDASAAPARIVTMREKVRVREHGRLVTRWRLRHVYAQAKTVMETHTIRTPQGIRLVTRPVTRYHVVYRKSLVTVNGKTGTVVQPVTNTETLVNTSTQRVTVTNHVTDTRVITVTQPVTVVTTVVSTETVTVPLTVTVTLPTLP